MKNIIILSIFLSLGLIVEAQTYQDAVQYSRITSLGSARSAGMAGAFGALGGELSTLSTNPGGIGVFRRSEISITPSLNFASTQSDGINAKDNSFQMGNLGVVFAFYSPKFDWKGINFGINYTNLNNFNRKSEQIVWNSSSSWLDALAYSSNNYPSDELNIFTNYLAYQCWLINQDLDESSPNYGYYTPILQQGELVAQTKNIKEDGNQGEYTFSFGTNYKDKLYLGFTIGIQSLWYKMNSDYTEAPGEQSPSGLDYYTFYDYKKMNGVGTNLKFGLIYRPIPELRIGAAIHTPTWYNMNYKMATAMYSSFWTEKDPNTGRDGYAFDIYNDEYSVDFNMRTPWRAILSLATVLNQRAIISVDYEYVDYRNANFSEISDYNSLQEKELNQSIKDYLRATHNVRIGAEFRVNSTFSLRAGYAFWDSPYHNETNQNYNRLQALTAGAGLNFGSFYCDAAFIHKFSENETVFYSDYIYQSDPVKNKYLSNEARITLGIKF